jgi:hypothetical protein
MLVGCAVNYRNESEKGFGQGFGRSHLIGQNKIVLLGKTKRKVSR